MFELVHSLAMFAIDFFKPRRRLEVENLFLRHQLSIILRRAPPRLRPRGSDRALMVWLTGSGQACSMRRVSSNRRPSFADIVLVSRRSDVGNHESGQGGQRSSANCAISSERSLCASTRSMCVRQETGQWLPSRCRRALLRLSKPEVSSTLFTPPVALHIPFAMHCADQPYLGGSFELAVEDYALRSNGHVNPSLTKWRPNRVSPPVRIESPTFLTSASPAPAKPSLRLRGRSFMAFVLTPEAPFASTSERKF